MTQQQQQQQGEAHTCNEMMPEEHQHQMEASSERNGGVERSDALSRRRGSHIFEFRRQSRKFLINHISAEIEDMTITNR